MINAIKRLLRWLSTDGKTTAAAVIYATVDTLITLPDVYTLNTEDLAKRAIRIAAITLIGIYARDRKPPGTK